MWCTALWSNENTQPLQWGMALAVSLAAAVLDIRSRRIPNWLTGPALLGGLTCAVIVAGLPGLADALVAVVVLMAPYFLLFLLAGGGAGDAKLMAALGAWLGLTNGLFALAGVCLAGGVLGILYAGFQGRLKEVGRNLAGMVLALWWFVVGRGRVVSLEQTRLPLTGSRTKMPYGVAVLVGTAVAAIGVMLWRSKIAP